MLYTVQNASGEVYGGWPLPEEPGYTAEEWATKLHELLEDIEGINGITSSPLAMDSRTGEAVDRVVIDIEPWHYTRKKSVLEEHPRLERVHRTVGMIAGGETLLPPTESRVNILSKFLSRISR